MRKRVLLLAGFSIAFVSAVFIILFKRFFVGADELMPGRNTLVASAILLGLAVILLYFIFVPRADIKGSENRVFRLNWANPFSLSLALLVLGLSAFAGLINQKIIAKKVQETSFAGIKEEVVVGDKILNPFWDEYEKIASDYGLSIEQLKYVSKNRMPNFKNNALFKDEPKSVDVLVIGDSSISWSAIHSITEQFVKDKKIRFFAYESLPLNPRTAKMFKILANYYLKDDAIIIFSNNFAITRDYKINEITMHSELEKFILNEEFKNIKTSLDSNETVLLGNETALQEINQKSWAKANKPINELVSEYLGEHGFSLISPQFYTTFFEKYINKEWFDIKARNSGGYFIDFNDGVSVTQHLPKYYIATPTPKLKKIDIGITDSQIKNVKEKLEAINKISPHKKVFLLNPFTSNGEYLIDYTFYKTFYEPLGFDIINLGEDLAAYPKMQLEGSYHAANSGSFVKSIVFGKKLQEYLNKQR